MLMSSDMVQLAVGHTVPVLVITPMSDYCTACIYWINMKLYVGCGSFVTGLGAAVQMMVTVRHMRPIFSGFILRLHLNNLMIETRKIICTIYILNNWSRKLTHSNFTVVFIVIVLP